MGRMAHNFEVNAGRKGREVNQKLANLEPPSNYMDHCQSMREQSTLQPENMLLQVSTRSGTVAARIVKSDNLTSHPEDAGRLSIADTELTCIDSEKKSEAFAVSKSNLGNSKKIVDQNK